MGPRSNGARLIPPIASDGIHDIEVTDDSIRTAQSSSLAANGGILRVVRDAVTVERAYPSAHGGPASQKDLVAASLDQSGRLPLKYGACPPRRFRYSWPTTT